MLSSMQGQWFYEQGFVPLPADIDVGHPPLLPSVLAFSWHYFGKTLAVSHWTMLPFLLMIVYAAHHLTLSFFTPLQSVLCASLILIQPTLLAQASLVSPDVLLIAFFMLALCCFFEKKYLLNDKHKQWKEQIVSSLYAVALMLLAMTSLRGMMCVVMLLLAECGFVLASQLGKNGVVWQEQTLLNPRWYRILAKVLISYLPAFMLFLIWFLWHKQTTGTIGWHNPASTEFYRPLWDLVGLGKNMVVFVWRLADFGAVSIWLVLGASIYAAYKQKILPHYWDIRLAILGGVMLGVWLIVVSVLPIYSISHRYFLPLHILSIYATFRGMMLFPLRIRRVLYCASCLALLTGHLWVFLYPQQIAKGWDATLAYLPYHAARCEVLARMQERDISSSTVASRNFATFAPKFLDLETSANTSIHAFRNVPLDSTRYVFWSSVLNGFSDDDLQRLQTWECVERVESFGIIVELRRQW